MISSFQGRILKNRHGIILLIFLLAFPLAAWAGEVKASYLYTLSDFNGPISSNWVNFAVDREKRETYVIDSSEKSVRLFNDAGMEIYRFGDEGAFGAITSLAVAGNGDIFILSRTGSGFTVHKCNFRGEPQSTLALANIPEEFTAEFLPDIVRIREGQLYLADRNSMKVAVTDFNGTFESGYDLAAIIGYDAKMRRDSGMAGFDVDRNGELLFTVPVNFTAFVVSPDKKVRSFGTRGSSPGKFNIVSGIATDDRGNIYIADTLRCVVMIFDKDFNFVTEFGYRGFEPGNLINPAELTVNSDKVFVSQTRGRGVSVYRTTDLTINKEVIQAQQK